MNVHILNTKPTTTTTDKVVEGAKIGGVVVAGAAACAAVLGVQAVVTAGLSDLGHTILDWF